MRLAILLHRYLGIALGLIVSLWCLSGFVMMYVPYPELTDAERVIGLAPLADTACCSTDGLAAIEREVGDDAIVGLRIEAIADRPVLRASTYFGERAFDLASGSALQPPGDTEIAASARSFAQHAGIDGAIVALGTVDRDQWTVYGEYNVHRPLHQFAARDSAGTQWYVSSTTGEVVQLTTAHERFWSWLGAVPHWLYFTALRRNGPLWAQTVIWLTIVSLFLAVIGIYIGINRLKRYRNGALSPYRGMGLWHHYTGLVFGVLVLTWLASGLLSMNPWGALEGRSYADERDSVNGGLLDAEVISRAAAHLARGDFPPDTVRIDTSRFLGETAFVAWQRDGRRTLLDVDSARALRADELPFSAAAAAMRPEVPVSAEGWLEEDDTYYYSHHERADLPVYRVIYADGERLYLDGTTGELVYAVDSDRRWHRWLFAALHRGDFSAAVRGRPAWDLLMLPLLAGVTLSALTGTWLGVRRLLR
jgi:hypothetical protein